MDDPTQAVEDFRTATHAQRVTDALEHSHSRLESSDAAVVRAYRQVLRSDCRIEETELFLVAIRERITDVRALLRN